MHGQTAALDLTVERQKVFPDLLRERGGQTTLSSRLVDLGNTTAGITRVQVWGVLYIIEVLRAQWHFVLLAAEALGYLLPFRNRDWSLARINLPQDTSTLAVHSLAFLSLSALLITDTELKLMAAAAMIGLSRMPNLGYRMPAATGTPSAL